MTMTLAVLLLAGLAVAVQSAYLVGYQQSSGENQRIVNAGITFAGSPSAEQVADLYVRASGLPPILWEDDNAFADAVNLPGADMLSKNMVKPQIVEITGGVLPASVVAIAGAQSSQTPPPSLHEVMSVLAKHGVEAEAKSFDATGDKAMDMHVFFREVKAPVVVLHHSMETPRRQLSTNNVTELSEAQISEYQICMWAGVVFVLLLLSSVCGLANMEVEPDSLLYAKFQSGRTDGKRE